MTILNGYSRRTALLRVVGVSRRRGSSEIPKRKEPNCLESDSVYGDLQNRLGRKNRPQVRVCVCARRIINYIRRRSQLAYNTSQVLPATVYGYEEQLEEEDCGGGTQMDRRQQVATNQDCGAWPAS